MGGGACSCWGWLDSASPRRCAALRPTSRRWSCCVSCRESRAPSWSPVRWRSSPPTSAARSRVALSGSCRGRRRATPRSVRRGGGRLVWYTLAGPAAFLINIPITAIALYATWRHVPESRSDDRPAGFDWLGAIIVGGAVGGLAFGTVYGQQREWRDPVAYVMLAVGALAAVGMPFYMARARNPLIPLSLFKSRAFSTINVSTLLIYGALFASGYNQALFVQGTLGYSAAASGLMFIPGGLLLTLLSPRFGTLAGRYGARPFLIIGPLLMAAACLLYARVPATSAAWNLRADVPSSLLPPTSYLIDFFPATLIFGLGLGIMVAPLTAALMASVPVSHAGLASSINNAISRIGPQLAGALIFVAVTAVFYTSLASRVPGLDPNSTTLRAEVSPLNRPTTSAPADVAAQARYASADAFHTAMLISVALLIAGAAANAVGVARKQPEETLKAA